MDCARVKGFKIRVNIFTAIDMTLMLLLTLYMKFDPRLREANSSSSKKWLDASSTSRYNGINL